MKPFDVNEGRRLLAAIETARDDNAKSNARNQLRTWFEVNAATVLGIIDDLAPTTQADLASLATKAETDEALREVDEAIRKALNWIDDPQEIPSIEAAIVRRLRAVYFAGFDDRLLKGRLK